MSKKGFSLILINLSAISFEKKFKGDICKEHIFRHPAKKQLKIVLLYKMLRQALKK